MAVVYQHINSQTNEVFYIGIGVRESRAYAFYPYGRSAFWNNYVKKHGEPIVEIISRTETVEEAFDIEKKLIKAYGKRVDGTGVLVNQSDGGDGSPGVKHSKETIAKRSATVRGRKHSAETKRKMSEARKGKVLPAEYRANISKSKQGEKASKARKVLDTATGQIFGCAKMAAEFYGIKHRYLCARLAGERRNNTTLKYLT